MKYDKKTDTKNYMLSNIKELDNGDMVPIYRAVSIHFGSSFFTLF